MGRTRYSVRDEVKDTAATFYRGVSTKNMKVIDSVWAHEAYASVAGRSGKIRQGWDQVRAYWERRFRQIGDVRVEPKLVNMMCHAVGDVAWLSGTEIRTVTDGDRSWIEELRVTCVLERKTNNWQIVCYHASMPAEERATDDVLRTAS